MKMRVNILKIRFDVLSWSWQNNYEWVAIWKRIVIELGDWSGFPMGRVNREGTWVSVSVRIGLGFMSSLDNLHSYAGVPRKDSFSKFPYKYKVIIIFFVVLFFVGAFVMFFATFLMYMNFNLKCIFYILHKNII